PSGSGGRVQSTPFGEIQAPPRHSPSSSRLRPTRTKPSRYATPATTSSNSVPNASYTGWPPTRRDHAAAGATGAPEAPDAAPDAPAATDAPAGLPHAAIAPHAATTAPTATRTAVDRRRITLRS